MPKSTLTLFFIAKKSYIKKKFTEGIHFYLCFIIECYENFIFVFSDENPCKIKLIIPWSILGSTLPTHFNDWVNFSVPKKKLVGYLVWSMTTVVGWSDFLFLAIFENGHIPVDWMYFYEFKFKK